MKQENQLSCCARGGTWFNKCGKDKEKFEHTWKEGIKACKIVEESLAAQEQQFVYSYDSESNDVARASDSDGVVVTSDCQGYCKLTHIGVIAIGILLVGSQIQM